MLSRKNYKERLRKMEPKKDRFSIRKFTIGAASVLIGFFYMNMGAGTAHAEVADKDANANKDAQHENEETTPHTATAAVEQGKQLKNNVTVKETANVDKSAKDQDAKNAAATNSAQDQNSNQVGTSQAKTNEKKDASRETTTKASDKKNVVTLDVKKDLKGKSTSAKELKSNKVANKDANTLSYDEFKKQLDDLETKLPDMNKKDQDTAIEALQSKIEKLSAADQAKLADFMGIEGYSADQGTKVFDLQSFTGALANKDIHEITLTHDIDFSNYKSQTNLATGGLRKPGEMAFNDGKLIESNNKYYKTAHDVVIDGQGHTLNMGDTFISFWNNNYNQGDKGWNITFKNLTIKQTNKSYSPFYFGNASADNQKKSSLTFENVTANVARTLNTYDGNNVAINFKGNNNVTVENLPLGVNAVNGLTVDFSGGTTTFDIESKDIVGNMPRFKKNWANATIYASSNGEDAVNIAKDATVNINSKSDNVRGISAGTIDITNPQEGTVTVAGKLNETLAKGHSTAIWAGNLNIDGGKVTINTMQDNESDSNGGENGWVNGVSNYDGTHYAPISLGIGSQEALQNSNSALNITNNGELHVTRGNVETLTPLITFGSGGNNDKSTFKMNVGDGAILDLQDGARTVKSFKDKYAAHLGNPGSIYYPGMIHMFGVGSKDTLSFGNVKYVNMQRTGEQRGVLISLEGGKSGALHNGFNQTSLNNQMPFAQWMNNNTDKSPDFAWIIKSVTSQNGAGNTDVSFVPTNMSPQVLSGENVGKLFGQSNGSVVMAPIQQGDNAARYNNGSIYGTDGSVTASKTASYLQNFLDNFNWWTPRRISFGTSLMNDKNVIKDAEKYKPETKTINATTQQKLADLKVKDGIKDLLNENLQPVSADGIVDFENSTWGVDWSKTPFAQYIPSADLGKALTKDQIDAIVGKQVDSDADEQAYKQDTVRNLLNSYNTFVGSYNMTPATDKNGNLIKKAAYDADDNLINAATATIVYEDGSVTFANIPINVTAPKENAIYQPAYDPMNVEQGKSASEDPSYKENTTKNTDGETITINPDGKAPEGTKYEIPATANVPFATVDPSTGTLTIAPTADNSKTGLYNVPVTVTYPDKSTDPVNVPVYIGDATHTGKITTDPNDPSKVTGAYEVVTKAPADLKAHETTENSMDLKPGDAVQAINHYTIGEDGKITKTSVDPKDATIAWKGEAPSTVVPTATASEDINGTVSVTVDGTTVDSNKMTIPAAGATSKNVDTPVKVTAGSDLTKDQFNDLVNTKIPADQIASTTWASAPEKGKDATIKITFTDKDANGQPTYLNVTVPAKNLNVVPNGEYDPSYKPVSVEPGKTATDEIQTPNGVPAPDGTTFTKGTGDNVPDWASVDDKGTITLKPGTDVKPGHYTVPVSVKEPGKDAKTIEAPVTVTGMNHDTNTYYGNQSSTGFSATEQSYHKTSYDYTPEAAKNGFDTITVQTGWNGKDYTSTEVYKLNADGTKFVSDKGHSFDASAIHYTWINDLSGVTTPNTNVTNFDNGSADTLYKVDGKVNSAEQTAQGQSLPGNSKWRYNFSVDQDVVPELSLGFSTYSSWSNVYFNFYGATAKDDLTAKTGSDVPTDASSLEGYLNMGQLPTGNFDNGKLTGATWATQPGKDGKFVKGANKGTVRLEFNNDPKNYLDVPVTITANGEVAPTEESFTQSIIYKDANGNEIKTVENAIKGTFTSEKPATVSAEEEKSAIDNNVPENWKIASSYKYPAAETVSTKTPAAIEVLVEHGTKDITPTTPGVDPNDPKSKYAAMFAHPTRTINVHNPATGKVEHRKQVVWYGRDGVEDLVTGKVTAKPDAKWVLGKVENNKFVATPDAEAQWPEFTAPTTGDFAGYIPSQTKVDAEKVTPETKDTTVSITYNKKDSDAEKYTPEGQPIDTPKGVIPDPSEGIKNKDKLPEGTKYTWEDPDKVKDDVNKPGTHDETITVTYPDKSTDTVKVPVTVKPGKTDADKYTPEPNPITTPQGVVPNAPEGIKNKDEMPKGTKYTWEDPDKVKTDVNTPGKHDETITVTYPDGSKDTVTVPVTVKPGKTDADKYTPEPNPITTPQGVVPDPSEGIKNKDEMPKGTKYTWEDPDKVKTDVNTPGKHDETITVTYPDGSKDTVTVPVTVEEPETPPYVPTDADTHTPEGQPIKTPEGTVPDPSEGIKNKDEMPDGTKYTWEDPDKVANDVKTPGKHDETIVVTYPDGSKDTVTVPVTVPEPEPQEIHTNKGQVPDPSEGIKNKDEMPDGTKYTWKDPDKVANDVKTPGTHDETIVITYPDGTTQEITVPVVVVEPEPEENPSKPEDNKKSNINDNVRPNGENNGYGNETVAPNAEWLKEHGYIVTVGPNGQVLDYHKASDGQGKIIYKKTLPQTGAKQNSVMGAIGLGIAAIGSLFGLGAGKKRRDR